MHMIATDASAMVLQPTGHLNAASAFEFEHHLFSMMTAHRPERLLINLGAVESCDNEGLKALMAGLKLARCQGCLVQLCAVPATVRMILEITQLDQVCEILEAPYVTHPIAQVVTQPVAQVAA